MTFAKMRHGEQVLFGFALILEVRKMDSFLDLLEIPADHEGDMGRGHG